MTERDVDDLIWKHYNRGGCYSRSMKYCEILVRELYKDGFSASYSYHQLETSPSWMVSFGHVGSHWAANESLPLAICLAALRKAGVEFKNEEYKPHYWRSK